jgi:hypothetical protein
MIAYCDLTCSACPAYKATKSNDLEMAKHTAEQWSKAYNLKVSADDVWCDGCQVEDRKCAHCNKCEIRACGQKYNVKNCAYCAEYACDLLVQFLKMVPDAKKTLNGIKASL